MKCSSQDVYYVTMTNVVHWLDNPKETREITNDIPWSCKAPKLPPPPCESANSCKVVVPKNATSIEDKAGETR